VFGSLHSTLSHAIPALLIQSSDVLRDSAARDAAMPNIRVVLLVWWTAGAKARGPKVVTCVKLRHVQQLVGRPSRFIVPVVRRELSEVGVYIMGRREREGTRRGRARQYIWDQRTCTVVYFLTIMTLFSAINPMLSKP
jgi:hypothetical protein